MIPFLIFMILKKSGWKGLLNNRFLIFKLVRSRLHLIIGGFLILLLTLIPKLSRSQGQLRNYKIVQGGDEIGWMRLEKNIHGNRSTYVLTSEIKTRVILLIKVCAKETAEFENGKLIHSTQFRKTNGDVKLNKQTRLIANKYEVEEDGRKKNLALTNVTTNLLSLYFYEPAGINMLYSDKFECFVNVTKTSDGGYKVKFPDDNSNIFYYSGGICTKIKINHTFYSATVIIKP